MGDILPRDARRHRGDRQHGPCPDQHHQGRAVPAAPARGPGGRGGPGVCQQAGPQGRHAPRGDHRRALPPQHKEPRLAHPGLVRHHRRGPLRRPRLDCAEGRRQGDRELTPVASAALVVVREWMGLLKDRGGRVGLFLPATMPQCLFMFFLRKTP